MTSPRHRGTDTRPRRSTRGAQVAVALLVGGVVAASLVRALAGDGASTTSFTGVVTQFADEGALMCVQRADSSDAPFCDLYYVPPGTPQIRVGDRVMVDTITSSAADGSQVSGMLVTPLP